MKTETPELDVIFAHLAEQWRKERGATSMAKRMAEHPAYRKIVALGEKAVPLILAELERQPDHWFVALHEITGAREKPGQIKGNGRGLDRLGTTARLLLVICSSNPFSRISFKQVTASPVPKPWFTIALPGRQGTINSGGNLLWVPATTGRVACPVNSRSKP